MDKNERIIWIIIAFIVSVYAIMQSMRPQKLMDFESLYCNGVAMRTGLPLEQTCAGTVMGDCTVKGLPYPAIVKYAFAGFSVIPYNIAKVIWVLFKAFIILSLIYVIRKDVLTPASNIALTISVSILAFSSAILSDLGNITTIMVLLITLAITQFNKRRWLSIVLILLAASMKYYPILALLLFIHPTIKDYKSFFAGLLGFVLITIIQHIINPQSLNFIAAHKDFYWQGAENYIMVAILLVAFFMNISPPTPLIYSIIYFSITYPSIYNYSWMLVPLFYFLAINKSSVTYLIMLLICTHAAVIVRVDPQLLIAHIITFWILWDSDVNTYTKR